MAAMIRRIIMKPLLDPKQRALLHLPAGLGKILPLVRVIELPFFLKVHQMVVVAFDSISTRDGYNMLPILVFTTYIKLLADLCTMGKHALATLRASLAR